MNIAHVVSTFPPYHGGTGNVCYQQLAALRQSSCTITVYTPAALDASPTETAQTGVIHLKPWLRYGNAALMPQLARRLASADIIHVHYPFLGIELPLLLLYAVKRKKVIILLQYQMDLVGHGLMKMLFTLHRWLVLPLIISISQKVMVSSWDYFEHSAIYNFYGRHPEKFIEVANGVDFEKFIPRLIESSNKHQTSQHTLLFVGALDKAHYFKGLPVLLQALRQVSDICLVIVGGGNLEAYYAAMIKRYGLQDRVRMTGKVSDDQLVRSYQECDALVLPSTDKTEAFGLVLLEALACGKPVIASDLPGVRSIVEYSGNGLLFRVGDAADLARQIQALMQRLPSVQNAQETRKRLQKKYSWKAIAAQLLSIYSATNS